MSNSFPPNPITPNLYDTDFVQWAEQQSDRIARKDLHHIDWANVAEEIADLGRREKRELENRLDVLLNHLLKRGYVDRPNDYRGWELTIKEQRKQLRRLLRDSPSLRRHYDTVRPEFWQEVRTDVADEYPAAPLPDTDPFPIALDPLLTDCFW